MGGGLRGIWEKEFSFSEKSSNSGLWKFIEVVKLKFYLKYKIRKKERKKGKKKKEKEKKGEKKEKKKEKEKERGKNWKKRKENEIKGKKVKNVNKLIKYILPFYITLPPTRNFNQSNFLLPCNFSLNFYFFIKFDNNEK